jgi:hypothetical protein
MALVILSAAATARAQSNLYATGRQTETSTFSTFYRVNPSSGALTPIGPINFEWVGALTVHPSTHVLYAIAAGDVSNTLITIDPTTGAGTTIGTLADPTGASCGGSLPCYPTPGDLAFKPDGTLVGWIGGRTGYLTIDPTTALVTLVPLPFSFRPGMSPMTIGPDGYGYASWDESNIFKIDLSTGAVNGPTTSIPATSCGEALFLFTQFAFDPGSGVLYGTMATGGRGDAFASNPCLVIIDRTDPDAPFTTEIGLMGLPGSSSGITVNPWITGLAFAAAPSSGNTPVGSPSSVTPADVTTGATPVTLRFDNVTTAGLTTLSMQTNGPALPSGFSFAGTSAYYQISTTAVYTGFITVCIDDAGVGVSGTPHLFHFTGGTWVDVPVTVGGSPSIVCGRVASLSPFALLTPAGDTVAPVIHHIAATPNELWPPRNQMVPVSILVDVSDTVDAHPSCRIASVSSEGTLQRHEHDPFEPDWQVTGPLTLNLRAERAGSERDRLYRIAVACADASGNAARTFVVVTVPHDRGR